MGDRNLTDFATPSYLEFVYGVSTAYSESWRLMTWNDITPGGWMSTLQQANYSYLDIVYVFLCAVLWTLLRVFCSKAIFQVSALVSWSACPFFFAQCQHRSKCTYKINICNQMITDL